LESR
jgi:serine/threonine protein kinase